jgi:hypothetical protein
VPIKHAFTSAKADGADATIVRPSDWNANHSIDTYVDFPAIAQPANPAAATMRMWAKNRAGRMFPTVVDAVGTDFSCQPGLFSNYYIEFIPNTGTTVPIANGTIWTARNTTGAMSTPAPAVTNRYTMMRRCDFAAGAVAGQGSGIQAVPLQFMLGNAAMMGGFWFFCRFGFTAYSAAARLFIGLSTQNAAFAAAEPSTVNNTCGLGKDSGDATVSFLTRNGTGPTKAGAFTPATNTIYDFTMYAAPNSTTVNYRLADETNGTVIFDNLSTTTTVPVVNTLMSAWAHIGASSAVAQTLGVSRLYVETDF